MRTMLLGVVVVALFVPVSSAAPIDLYAHINGVQDFMLSPQEPDPAYSETVPLGLNTHSGCVSDPADAQHFTDRQYHTWYGLNVDMDVIYDHDDGIPRFTHGRDLLSNLTVNEIPGHVQWYLAAAADGRATAAPIVLPAFVLEATARVGNEVSVANAAYNAGAIFAQGSIGPVDLYPGMSHPGVSTHDVDGWTVYGFTVPLDVNPITIPTGEGFNLRLDAYVDQPLCSEGYVMPNWLKVHTSPGLRPLMHLDVAGGIELVAIHATTSADATLLHVEATSPFSHGDTLVRIETPVASRLVEFDDGSYRGCGPHGHCQPLGAIWTFRLAHEEGTFPVNITVSNLQGTATETRSMWLRVADGQAALCSDAACSTLASDKGVPGAPAIGLITALGALAFFRRRLG